MARLPRSTKVCALPPDRTNMNRSKSRGSLHTLWRRHRWSLVGVLAAVTVGLAIWGFGGVKKNQRSEHSGSSLRFDRLVSFRYITDAPLSCSARSCSLAWPFTVVLAGIWVLGSIFNEQATRLRVRFFYRNHLIICGLGRFGIRTALAFRHQGYRVVVIDLAPAQYLLEDCREKSIPVLRGDANQTALLRVAGLRRARISLRSAVRTASIRTSPFGRRESSRGDGCAPRGLNVSFILMTTCCAKCSRSPQWMASVTPKRHRSTFSIFIGSGPKHWSRPFPKPSNAHERLLLT